MNAKDKFILGFCRLGIAGLSPKAPGTCGTALALVFAPFLFLPFGLTGRVIFLLLLFVAGSLAVSRGETLLGKKDPGEIVVDELAALRFQLDAFYRGLCPLPFLRYPEALSHLSVAVLASSRLGCHD